MRFAVLAQILVLMGCTNIEQEPNLYEPMRVCLYSAAGRTISKEFPSRKICVHQPLDIETVRDF